MPRLRLTPQQQLRLLELLADLLNRLPVPPKWRGVTATLAAIVMLFAGALVDVHTQPQPVLATALTADNRDVNLLISNNQAEVVKPHGEYKEGHIRLNRWEAKTFFGVSVPTAPVMTWEFPAIRQRETLRMCFSEVDDFDRATGRTVGAQARKAVAAIWALYPAQLPRYVESCEQPHTIAGTTATADCGMNNAMGCALYASYGRLMRITTNPVMSDEGAFSVFLHEYGHFLNLGHTGCDHPHPTNMSPIYSPHGPACGAHGQTGPFREDLDEAIQYYNLGTRSPTPTVSPTASPPPTVLPTPLPTPTPQVRVFVQRWTAGPSADCPNPVDGYCIAGTELVGPPLEGAWYPLLIITPQGEFQYPVGFPRVLP